MFKHLLSRSVIYTVALVVLACGEAWAGADRDVKKAGKLYGEEKYAEALELYDKALSEKGDDPVIQYNRAAAFYRLNEFKKAAAAFLKSIAGVDETVEPEAVYNVGNSEFRIGEKGEKTDIASSLANYKKALNFYKRAMELAPTDQDAKYNYEFTLKKIREQEKKQEEQDQQEEQQQDQQQQQQQDQQDQKKQQQQQQEQEQKKKEQEKKEQEKQEQDQQEREEEQEQQQFPKGQKPDTIDEFEGEIRKEEAEMLLRSQDEEEARKRAEMKKGNIRRRPPVLKDW
jgi:tetratricopeptide (TPR) repeat protein